MEKVLSYKLKTAILLLFEHTFDSEGELQTQDINTLII